MSIFESLDGATYSKEEYYTKKRSEHEQTVTKQSLSVFFHEKLKALCKSEGRTISTRDIAEMLGIRYELFRKMINRESPTNRRDCIIAICAMLRVGLDDTNLALHYNDDMPPLDDYHPRDLILIDILNNQSDDFKTIDEINEKLEINYQPILDIIHHKQPKPKNNKRSSYKPVRKHFQCTIGGIKRFSEPDRFLDLLYDVENFYNMRTSIELEDHGKRYEISIRHKDSADMWEENLYQRAMRKRITPSRKTYTIYAYPHKNQPAKLTEYDSIEQTGLFQEWFLEIERTEHTERQKLFETVNDTRNYGSRISAKVINSELHVFCETYNYDVPELAEYCLMDWCRGTFTLYILKQSGFMQMYLSREEYTKIFGKPDEDFLSRIINSADLSACDPIGKKSGLVKEAYSSIADIEDSIYDVRDTETFETGNDALMIDLHVKTYKRMQSKIRRLIDSLKTGKAHICCIEELDDHGTDLILEYFGVRNLFSKADKNCAVFTLSDGKEITLSVNDFMDAFALGLRSVEDTAHYYWKHGTLNIHACL